MSLSSSDTPTSDVDAAAVEAAAASVSCGAVSVDDGFMSGFTAGTTGSVETSSIYSLSMFLILIDLFFFYFYFILFPLLQLYCGCRGGFGVAGDHVWARG